MDSHRKQSREKHPTGPAEHVAQVSPGARKGVPGKDSSRPSIEQVARQAQVVGGLHELHERLLAADQQARDLLRKAETAAGRLQAIQSVTEAALARLDLEHLLRELAARIQGALAGDAAVILLATEDGKHLALHAASGLAQEIEVGTRVPMGHGIAGRIAATRKPLMVDDLSRVETVQPDLRERVKSLAGAPLLVDGQVIGVVQVGTVEARRFTQGDLQLLQHIADLAAWAIDRVQAEEARDRSTARAQAERARFQTILDSAPHGIIFAEADTGQILANPAAVGLLGRPPDPKAGLTQYVGMLCRPDGRPLTLERLPLTRALAGKAVPDTELLISRPDGVQIPVMASAAPVRGPQGRVIGAVVLFQDITARKELERMREEWTSIVAHDMRQPITVIAGYVQVLQRQAMEHGCPAAEARALEHIQAATNSLSKIVNDLLDLSRLEARQLSLDRKAMELVALVREVVERTALITRGHPVQVRVEGPIPPVWADPARVEQVLGNLLSNAAKYGYPETEIWVGLRQDDGFVQVSVTNQGRGIARRELPNIFTRFHRTRLARERRAPGIGLGLHIARGLVEAHGGRIWVESTPGKTTTFYFTLPISEH